MQLPSATATGLLRAALLAVDDQLGTGAGRKNPELVGAIAQAIAIHQLVDAVKGLEGSAQDGLSQLETIANAVHRLS